MSGPTLSARSMSSLILPWRSVRATGAPSASPPSSHDLLVEKLARGDAVDLRTQRRDPVFIFMLDTRLPGNRCAQKVVAQDQIGRRAEISHCQCRGHRNAQSRHPRLDRQMPNLVARCQDEHWCFATFGKDAFSGFTAHEATPKPKNHTFFMEELHTVKVNKSFRPLTGGLKACRKALLCRACGGECAVEGGCQPGLCAGYIIEGRLQRSAEVQPDEGLECGRRILLFSRAQRKRNHLAPIAT